MPQHDSGGYCRYSQGSHSAVNIAGSVQAFITTMDSLKLNMAAVDQVWQNLVAAAEGFHTNFISCCLVTQIFPLMSDLLTNVNKVSQSDALMIHCWSSFSW